MLRIFLVTISFSIALPNIALSQGVFDTHGMTAEALNRYIADGGDVNAQDWRGWTPLILAVDNNSMAICTDLIDRGADINLLSYYHWSPLMYAIKNKNVPITTLLLEKGADVNVHNNNGQTPLLMAVEKKQHDIVKLLLKKEVDTYVMDAEGKTVLDYAAKNNDKGMLGLLIQGGVNPDIVNNEGRTCFHHNVVDYYTGNSSILLPLIKLGADPSIPCVLDLINPLYFEKKQGNTDSVTQLEAMGIIDDPYRIAPPAFVPKQYVKKDTWGDPEVEFNDAFNQFLKDYTDQGGDWQFTDKSGNTFLHWVCENGNPNWVEWAIQNGMDVNVVSQLGKTPLHRAVRVHLCEPAIRVLLEYGADIEATDFLGNTPLHYALFSNKNKAVEMLLAKNAPINAVNNYGMTPLHYAINCGNTNAVRLVQSMLRSGADPTIQDFKRETILHLACKGCEDFPELLQDVIINGGDVNQSNKMGQYPLHLTSKEANLTAILIQNGADIEARNYKGLTPLVQAIEGKNQEVVRVLIEAGADINASTYTGWTPLHYAVWTGSTELVQVLIDNGGDLTARTFDKESLMDIAKKFKNLEMAKFLKNQTANMDKTNETVTAKLFDEKKVAQENLERKQQSKKDDDERVRAEWMYSCEEDSLAMAVLKSDSNAVVKAVASGADINEYFVVNGSYHKTALYMAVRFQDEAMVRLLVEQGADINLGQKKPITQSPLHLAAWYGYLPMTQLLIELGADMNIANTDDTPFVTAVLRGKKNVAMFYMENGFDIHAKDKNGRTLLHRGIQWGSSTVKFLLEQGLKADSPDNSGRTPLYNYISPVAPDDLAVPKLLVKYGADVNAADRQGNTPLCQALVHDMLQTVKYLVEAGADVTIGTSSWKRNGPPIHLSKGNIETIALLMNHGADIHSLNKEGQNVIHSLVRNHSGGTYDAAALEYYLEQGVDINGKDEDGEAPIFGCIEYKRLDMLETLIENGANIEASDSYGRTPLWHAARSKDTFTVKMLLKYGAKIDIKDKSGETLVQNLQSPLYGDILEIIEAGG